jgi:hypothetical protein
MLKSPFIVPILTRLRVIAIPAIGGDPFLTWRRCDSYHPCLETSISIYHALEDEAWIHLYSFEEASKSNTLEQYAELLFQALAALYEDKNSNLLPIHFAAYSTGGLVLKIAITKARGLLPKSFVDCFHSVAFFGVPREYLSEERENSQWLTSSSTTAALCSQMQNSSVQNASRRFY